MEIKYIINFMLENRSFNQIYGSRFKDQTKDFINYLDGKAYRPEQIKYFNGEGYGRFSHQATLYSINTPDSDGKIVPCKGFAYANKSYTYLPIANEPNPPENVMAYFEPIPIFEFLADNYVLCTNYFSSLPGQTDPNRFFSLSGTSRGQVNDYLTSFYPPDIVPQTQRTILTELIKNKKSCKVYSNTNIPESIYLLRHLDYLDHYKSMDEFFSDVEKGTLPYFSYLEPAYEISNIPGRDDSPYVMDIVESVYNAVFKNKEIWNHCILIFNFDEHGGYFDHVHPPKAIPPDNYTSLFNFRQYGVRVPCLIVSPFVAKGILDNTVYDHTSVLATIERLSGTWPLTKRDAAAHSFLHLLDEEHAKIERHAFSDRILKFPFPPVTIESVAQLLGAFALIIYRLSETPNEKNKKLTAHAIYRVLTFVTKEVLENQGKSVSGTFFDFISEIEKKYDYIIKDIESFWDKNLKNNGNVILYKLDKFFQRENLRTHRMHIKILHNLLNDIKSL